MDSSGDFLREALPIAAILSAPRPGCNRVRRNWRGARQQAAPACRLAAIKKPLAGPFQFRVIGAEVSAPPPKPSSW
jgi:hypothetical protein